MLLLHPTSAKQTSLSTWYHVYMKHILAAGLLVVCAPLVAGLSMASVIAMDSTIGLQAVVWTGDINLMLALVFWGIITFGSISWWGRRWVEQGARRLAHAIQAGTLYAIVIVSAPVALPTLHTMFIEVNQDALLHEAVITLVACAALLGVVVNGAVLLSRRKA